jgi:pyruvate-ferredoxin/flavodoxin oxidoreductase
MIDDELVIAHRNRSLNPDKPFVRGTAQNPDVYFQGRETSNPFYAKIPTILKEEMKKFSEISGRNYAPVTYYGHPEAENVIVIMGSGVETVIPTSNSNLSLLILYFREYPFSPSLNISNKLYCSIVLAESDS